MAENEVPQHHRRVAAIGDARVSLGDRGVLPTFVSADWTKPQPNIMRAVIVLHGVRRNADDYFQSALAAQAAAGEVGRSALMIAPQLLNETDIEHYHLASEMLRWALDKWQGGELAVGPAPVSSFEALDAILAYLADRTLFPRLAQVVVAGHSGGGQVVQRYAIGSRGEAALTRAGIAVRYVVANPSSYAYFTADRPEPAIAAACPGYNHWKYGMESLPAYLADRTPVELEKAYVARRVIYLLGTRDIDPDHHVLDKTCMAEAQGSSRYARGHAYAQMMKTRNAGTPNHSVWDVPDVGHDGDKMFTSTCGLAALFDLPGCPAQQHTGAK